jgi:hypothetical protein
MRHPLLLVVAALLSAVGCASSPRTENQSWPFRYEQEVPTGGKSIDFPFPFGRWWEDPVTTADEIQVRPIYRRIRNREEQSVEHQVLWPIFKYKESPGKKQTWLLPFVYDRTVEVPSTGKRDRDWMVFPFFGGTDADEGDYFLIFPFVGNTHNLFGSERIEWFGWPFYVRARDREYESNYIFWPLIGWGEGGGKRMFRILPFYGEKSNEGRSWRRNLLWPFFSWGEEELNTKYPIRYFFFFPFYGQNRSDVAWQTTVLYPFFMFSGSERGWREYQAPWPLFRYKTHPYGYALRVWPFYSHSEFYDEEGRIDSRQNYYFWPLIWDSRFVVPRGRQEYTLVVPFYRRSRYFSTDDEDLGGDVQIWPLYRLRVNEDGSRVLSVLGLIPFSNWRSFEANWSFLWTVVEARRSADGKERSQSWLFGLIQHRSGEKGSYTGLTLVLEHAKDEESEKVQLLKGLLGWERDEEGDGIRLLWFLKIPL